jgi:hypothetical protein
MKRGGEQKWSAGCCDRERGKECTFNGVIAFQTWSAHAATPGMTKERTVGMQSFGHASFLRRRVHERLLLSMVLICGGGVAAGFAFCGIVRIKPKKLIIIGPWRRIPWNSGDAAND